MFGNTAKKEKFFFLEKEILVAKYLFLQRYTVSDGLRLFVELAVFKISSPWFELKWAVGGTVPFKSEAGGKSCAVILLFLLFTSTRFFRYAQTASGFQGFYRENSEIWKERFDYKEAAPQLLMQAFLQRIFNGGGRIDREYGLGRRRTDLFVQWPLDPVKGFYGEVQKVVIAPGHF